jgi:hypothetical protein
MDFSWQKILVMATAVVFAGFLLWKYRPRLPLPPFPKMRRPGRPSPEAIEGQVREGRERARTAKTPRERAASLFLAAEAAAQAEDGATAAMGLYLRAMRADATFCEPVRGIATLLRAERPELLETVLWRRLAKVPFSSEHGAMIRCAMEELASLYRRELRHRDRAKALQKLMAKVV